jgi:hypothetical protein
VTSNEAIIESSDMDDIHGRFILKLHESKHGFDPLFSKLESNLPNPTVYHSGVSLVFTASAA